MNCQDIILNRILSNNEICAGFSNVFHIKPSEVLAVEEIPIDPVSESIRILCQVQNVEGEFKQLISIYIRDQSVTIATFEDDIGRFCDIYGCLCLVSNSSENPYSMTLIRGLNNSQTVYLSSELFDEGQYTLEVVEGPSLNQ